MAEWITAVAAVTNAATTYHQGEKQLSQAKQEFAYEREAAEEEQQAANEEAIATKQALIAEQESMSNQQEVADENKNKKKTSYQKQYSAWNSTGEGFGLGSTTNVKLG